MSYRTVIHITERLNTKLLDATTPEDAFESAYGDLEELLEVARDASYHRSTDPNVHARFQRLFGQLSSIAADLKQDAYHRQAWGTLQEALQLTERIAGPSMHRPSSPEDGPVLDTEEANDLLRDSPEALLEMAERELRADPDSVVGAYMRGAALLFLGRHADAIASAEALAIRYPARHVATISSVAAALQGREDEALRRALAGMHLRLEARRPEPWQRVPGLRTLSSDEAEAIRQANVSLVQQALHWLSDLGWINHKRLLFAGLLAPSLSQSRQLLSTHLDDAKEPIWQDAARAGLARVARWRCEFLEAMEYLEGLQTDFARQERAFIGRDRRLLVAGEIELIGFGCRARLGRTETATGFGWDDEPLMFTEHDDRSEAQVADLLKDLASSWIATGFAHEILHEGPLSEEDELELDDEFDNLEELEDEEEYSLLDVDRFFALYDAEELDGVYRYTDEILAKHPFAPTAWGVRALVHLIRGYWDEAAKASERGVALSGCRALAAPRALLPLAEERFSTALVVAMDNLHLRLRSATPELPLRVHGFPTISSREGELLDQIENNAWRMAEELLRDAESDDPSQQLQLQLIGILLSPNPAIALRRLEELLPELQPYVGLKAVACTALARWRRHEGDLDVSERWLRKAEAALPSFRYTLFERERLERDRQLMTHDTIRLQGFDLSIELSRSGKLLYRTFMPDNSSETHSLTGWVDDPRPNAARIALRDAAVNWIESGFIMVEGEGRASGQGSSGHE
ncbi:MAG: hypothetical protein AAFV53_34120 [Myxococcota bacterium]